MTDSHEARLALERTNLARYRTRLANRRTFLAWCRTALSFMAFGFLLEKLDVFIATQSGSTPEALLTELGVLGKVTFLVAPMFILFAGFRYYQLEKLFGDERPGRSIIPEMLMAALIVAAAFGYVFF